MKTFKVALPLNVTVKAVEQVVEAIQFGEVMAMNEVNTHIDTETSRFIIVLRPHFNLTDDDIKNYMEHLNLKLGCQLELVK